MANDPGLTVTYEQQLMLVLVPGEPPRQCTVSFVQDDDATDGWVRGRLPAGMKNYHGMGTQPGLQG